MLNRLDDYPIHQTPEPIAHPASSDPNVYDRTWFNGYTTSGNAYFGFGMAVYPHRRVIDAAFSTVTAGGRQHCVFASGRAPLERTDMSVGPIRIEIVEPMRSSRIIVEDNEHGLSADLTFSTRTAAIEEDHQILMDGARKVMDATRFDQFGRWTGTISTPDGDMAVNDVDWWGTKDRSWGIRSVGEPVIPAPGDFNGVFFLWAPLVWDDHVSHAIFFDGADGRALVREGLTAPLYGSESEVPAATEITETRMATAAHRIRYHPGTRLAAEAEIDLVALDGAVRTISLEPTLRFQMKGLGYLHAVWRQGTWRGELAVGGESFDPDDLDLLSPDNLHVQQVVRAGDGTRTGIGVLEQICIGPYSPAGFTDFFDGAD